MPFILLLFKIFLISLYAFLDTCYLEACCLISKYLGDIPSSLVIDFLFSSGVINKHGLHGISPFKCTMTYFMAQDTVHFGESSAGS